MKIGLLSHLRFSPQAQVLLSGRRWERKVFLALLDWRIAGSVFYRPVGTKVRDSAKAVEWIAENLLLAQCSN